MNLTSADKRAARTFDRACELWLVHGPDQEVVRLGVAADEERMRGRRGADLEPVTVELLGRWWEEGLFHQAGSRLVPIRSPGRQVVADRRKKALDEAAGPKLPIYERALHLFKQQPGQFDAVAAALKRDDKNHDPPTSETLQAWWLHGLWVKDPATGQEVQARPPLSDAVANHIALHEQQADSAAATFRRKNKADTARNGDQALDVLFWEQRSIREAAASIAGINGRPSLDRVLIALQESLAEDLLDPGRISTERKYEWITRIYRLKLQVLQRQQAVIHAQTLLGGDRAMVLGVSVSGAPPTGPETTTPVLDASTAAELAERARELAENMESVSRLPEALDQALETEVSRPG